MATSRSKYRPISGQHGFTLVEVVVVIAVISILAGMLAPMLAQQIDQARREATQAHLATLADALREYHLDVYAFPADSGDSAADLAKLTADTASGWDGPYVAQARFAGDYATDAWGSPIDYAHTAGDTTVVLTSPGLDRTLGNADDIQLTVLMDFDAVRQRVDATYETLRLIAGSVYGHSPVQAPADFAIDSQWTTDAWGNTNTYLQYNNASAVVYSPGPDGVAGSPPPSGDDLFVALLWDPDPTSGGSATSDIVLHQGSVRSCRGDNAAYFQIDNTGTSDLVLTGMDVTWHRWGADLIRIKGSSSSTSCGYGTTLWDAYGCGSPDGKQDSTAHLVEACQVVTIPAGGSYWISELYFDEDMDGRTIQISLTSEPSGGGGSDTSSFSFTMPYHRH